MERNFFKYGKYRQIGFLKNAIEVLDSKTEEENDFTLERPSSVNFISDKNVLIRKIK